MSDRRVKTLAIAFATVAGVVAAMVPSTAVSAAAAEEHCVVRVTDRLPNGRLRTTSPVCYPTQAQALAAASGQGTSTSSLSSFVIGIHYDGAGFTGSSMTVVGDDCLGGWLNVSASWDNRISSTLNGCYRIRHFDGAGLSGSSEDTVGGGGNLGALNNKTTSIQYLAS